MHGSASTKLGFLEAQFGVDLNVCSFILYCYFCYISCCCMRDF